MNDEANVTHIVVPPRPKAEVRVIMPPPPTRCARCEKVTRSHKLKNGLYLCHGCYSAMSDDELDQWRSKDVDADNPRQAEE